MTTASWELSPLYRHASSHFAPSTTTTTTPFLVSLHSIITPDTPTTTTRLIIRSLTSLEILATHPLPSPFSSASATSTSTISISISPLFPHLILVSSSSSSQALVVHPFPSPSPSTEAQPIVARLDLHPAEGLTACRWTENGSAVIAWSASRLRISIYPLVLGPGVPSSSSHKSSSASASAVGADKARDTKTRTRTIAPLQILNPKWPYPLGFSFRPRRPSSSSSSSSRSLDYLAVLERHNGKDHVGIYGELSPEAVDGPGSGPGEGGWKLLRHFPLPPSSSSSAASGPGPGSVPADAAGLAWSPCGRWIAIWETAVGEYLIHFFTPDGRLLKSYAPYRGTPPHSAPASSTSTSTSLAEKERLRHERSTTAYAGLGIRGEALWHPTGEFIAVGGWDGVIRIITRLSWTALAELSVPNKVVGKVLVWREPTEWIERTRGKGIVPFDALPLPYSPLPVRPDLGRANPKMGIAKMAWSPRGRWLVAWNQSFPTTLFVYQFLSSSSSATAAQDSPSPSPSVHFRPLLHSILLHSSPIRSFEWQPLSGTGPEQELLAIATAEKGFTVWREPRDDVRGEEGGVAECVGVPSRAEFDPHHLRFSQHGDALLLADKHTFAVAYPVVDGAGEGAGAGAERVSGGEDLG